MGRTTSVLYAPCARLTLFGVGSSRNAATRPKIGSAGDTATDVHKDLLSSRGIERPTMVRLAILFKALLLEENPH